ncbi:MAG TPA: type II secretion system F family protein [Pirellulales bacterium]|nr:type II secretion system F family protein [Pirellulales bacterium]
MSSSLISAQSFPGLVLLGIAILASLNLFYRDRPEGEDPLHLAMTVIGRVMILTAFLEASLVFFNIFAIPLWILLACVLVYVTFRYWMRRRVALLAVMAAAARHWMPLAPAVESVSQEWRGWFGRRCRRLAEMLYAGMPLGEVLSNAGSLLPRRALAIVEVGVRTGNLSGAFAEAARQPASAPAMMRVWAGFWYLSMLALNGCAILIFVAIKIVPAFIKIFDDFNADLPGPTLALIQSCNWFVEYGPAPLALALFVTASWAVLWRVSVITWLPPPFNMIARRRETVVVLRSLALATESSRPLELALSALAEHYPSRALRARLRRTLAQMASGQPWYESLADQGLLRSSEQALVSSAERAGNLAWALREVADGIERRTALRAQRWLELVIPVCILFAGGIVMFIVVSLFVPLVSLIEKLV